MWSTWNAVDCINRKECAVRIYFLSLSLSFLLTHPLLPNQSIPANTWNEMVNVLPKHEFFLLDWLTSIAVNTPALLSTLSTEPLFLLSLISFISQLFSLFIKLEKVKVQRERERERSDSLFLSFFKEKNHLEGNYGLGVMKLFSRMTFLVRFAMAKEKQEPLFHLIHPHTLYIHVKISPHTL